MNANKFMRLALALSEKAKGKTFPNPLVGAVVVKGGKVIGRGFHRRAGGPHAEILALKETGLSSRGATLFCTFEPCAHYGRTGPCVKEIIRAGIKEVYVGMIDPNPVTGGKGIRSLREAGIKVNVGFLEEEIRSLNEAFICAMTKQRPLVTIKIAESLDGKIATKAGESRWITSQASREYAHRQRNFFDAIMAGVNTVLKDDPALEPDRKDRAHSLTKIIVDSNLKTPLSARLLKTKQPVIIAAVKKDRTKAERLSQKGACILYVKSDKGRLDLSDLLKKLNKREIRSVLVEGGAELIGSLLDKRLADNALVFIAPKIIGGRDSLSSVGGKGIHSLKSVIVLRNSSFKKIDEDILIEGHLT
jgi:diaminohydroxyphosphoribosylaminopyrimidine deaminase/5-amino-6-(5-phosphoribosylamino)uracil reductase